MSGPRHEMILASAGSGKTYTLTNRYVQLLANGVKPERIVALTFTRKAAGEFFDKILEKLADAATDADQAKVISRQIEKLDTTPDDYLHMLRGIIEVMPRLALGTFDSFFARITRAFPLELGLGGRFEVLENHAAATERARVLRSIFDDAGRGSHESQLEFMESFKRSTFGLEEKRFSSLLDEFIDKNHKLSLIAPDPDVWGNPARIWPDGSPWSAGIEIGTAAASLRSVVRAMPDLSDKQRDRFEAFFEALPEWSPGAVLPKPVEYLLKNTLAAWGDVGTGTIEVTIERKKVTFAGPACQALEVMVRAIIDAELQRRLQTTRGIFQILERYERIYDRSVRRAGRLTFLDVERLLTPGAGAPILAQTGAVDDAAEERRLMIDWRLDGRFDHWLLDEFQDTSYGQWSALHNLIDEVVQDPTGQRTFFFVGDVKQAIYGWRGGDSRLFREIANHYNAGGDTIHMRALNTSYRSCEPVLAMVNTVFGNAGAIAALFPATAASRWNQDWGKHASAKPDMPGHAAWLTADDEDGFLAITLTLLQEIRPLERGMSVAVLTQRNSTATKIADYLRREGGIPAMAESDLIVCTDNPVTSALISLFKAAAYPDDTVASGHIGFTPLLEILRHKGLTTPDALTTGLLAEVHRDGFKSTIERWWKHIENTLAPDDVFSRLRGQQLQEAARVFDESGSRDIAEFVGFAENYTMRDSEAAGVVRVMTVHKSKGLGFDIVILPELGGNSLAKKPEGLTVHYNQDRSAEWVLDLPTQIFRSEDTVLSEHVEEAAADTCYDRLALLYVAMTRAKQSLYAIAKTPGKSRSANYPALLGKTLGEEETELHIGGEAFACVFTSGDPNWFETITTEKTAADTDASLPTLEGPIAIGIPRFVARRPSGGKSMRVRGHSLFAPSQNTALKHGSAVHEALSLVEWWDPQTASDWQRIAEGKNLAESAIAEARSCLESENLGPLFQEPASSHTEVWRERMFEIVLGDEWITGVFDRVVVHRNEDGTIASVDVLDFKTDRITADPNSWIQAAGHHRGQMQFYRTAAASLTGTPRQKVTVAVIFTCPIGDFQSHAPPQFPLRG